MDKEQEELMEILRENEANPLDKDFVASYSKFATIRGDLSLDIQREIETIVYRAQRIFITELRRDLESATANKQRIDFIRKKAQQFAAVYEGTEFAKQARELAFFDTVRRMPELEPDWVKKFRDRAWQITTIFDSDIHWMVSELDKRCSDWQNKSFGLDHRLGRSDLSMSKPTIFISYSHKKEVQKNHLIIHLSVLQKEGLLDLWDDQRIGAGDDWYQKIQAAIAAASVAILLISADFLTSEFIRNEEVPRLLKRRKKEGLRIFPVIVSPCVWQELEWLARMEVRPKGGRPLSAGNKHQRDQKLATIAKEIAAIIKRTNTIPDVLFDQKDDHDQSFGRQLLMEVVERLEGLLKGVRINEEDLSRLESLLPLENLLKKSKSLNPYFGPRFLSYFENIRKQHLYLKDRETFTELSTQWWKALKEQDYKKAKDLISRSSLLSLLPGETENVKQARHEADRLEGILQKANEALLRLDEQLERLSRKELGYRAGIILDQIRIITPLLPDLPGSMQKKYEEAMGQFASGLKDTTLLPAGEGKKDLPPILEIPFSQAKVHPQVENLFILIEDQEYLRRQLERIEEDIAEYRPEIASLLRDQKRQLGKDSFHLSRLVKGWIESRIGHFFSKGRQEEVLPFLSELEDYHVMLRLLHEEDSQSKVIESIDALRQIQKLSQQVASFNKWSFHQEFLPLDESLFTRYPDSSLLQELKKKRTELEALNLKIEKAKRALSLGDLPGCKALIDNICGLESNQRLESLRDRLKTQKIGAKVKELIECNQFEEASKELAATAKRMPKDVYDQLRSDLEKAQKYAERLRKMENRLLEDLNSMELIELANEIKMLAGGQHSPISKVKVRELLDAVAVRLFGMFQTEINQIEVSVKELSSSSQIRSKIKDLEVIQGRIKEANKVFNTELLLESTKQKIAILKVLEAITLKEYDRARSMCAEGLGKDKDIGERQYLERTISFREAVELYKRQGECNQLLSILSEPWYGQSEFHITKGEMKDLCKDLLLQGRMREVPRHQVAESELEVFLLVDEVLRRGDAYNYKRLVEAVKDIQPGENDAAVEGIEILFHRGFKPERAPGLLFLWEAIPLKLQRRIKDSHTFAKRLEQTINEQVGASLEAFQEIQSELEARENVVVKEYLIKVEEVLHFLDEIEDLQQSVYEHKYLGDRKNEALNLYNKLQYLQTVQDQLQNTIKTGDWLRSPEIMKDLKRTTNALPANIKIAGQLVYQVNELIDLRSRIEFCFADLRSELEKGNFGACIEYWEKMQKLTNLPGYKEYLEEMAASFLGDAAFEHWRQPGQKSLKDIGLKNILLRFKENMQVTVSFVDRFLALTAKYHLDHAILAALIEGWKRASMTGREVEDSQVRERIRRDFFPEELLTLFVSEWPKVQTALSERAQKKLMELTPTEKFKTFLSAFDVISEKGNARHGQEY